MNPLMIAGLVGQGAGLLGGLFGGNPYEEAQKRMEQYYEQAHRDLSPFMQRASGIYPGYKGMFNRLINPEQLENQWVSGYQESPYARQTQEMARTEGLDTANAMGLGQSTPALRAIQTGASNIMNADRQQYLNDLMQKYGLGAQIGGNIYGIGANAGMQDARNAMQMGDVSGMNAANASQYLPRLLMGAGGQMLGQGYGMNFNPYGA